MNKHKQLRRQFAIDALNRIKSIEETYYKLRELGVDIMEYAGGVSELERAIALAVTEKNKDYQSAFEDVGWWLYDEAPKVVIEKIDGANCSINLLEAEAFVDWMLERYKK